MHAIDMNQPTKRSLFCKRLKRLRKAKGLAQHELAQLTNLAQNQICQYERGKHFPRDNHLDTLAKALGRSVQYLTGQNDRVIRLVTKAVNNNSMPNFNRVTTLIQLGLFSGGASISDPYILVAMGMNKPTEIMTAFDLLTRENTETAKELFRTEILCHASALIGKANYQSELIAIAQTSQSEVITQAYGTDYLTQDIKGIFLTTAMKRFLMWTLVAISTPNDQEYLELVANHMGISSETVEFIQSEAA